MKTLDEIARYNDTDKSSEIHNYCEKYEKYLNFDREKPIKILEIGVLFGSSVKTWSEFYPNATIVGIDINSQCKSYENDRIKIEIGSQDDINFLQSVVDKYGEFDMILDDGSHMQEHVLASFNFLFKHLKKGGTYVVEDSCCAYWPSFGGGLYVAGSSVEYFKKLVDDVNFNGYFCDNFEPNHARREDILGNSQYVKESGIRTDIESINFLNSIILVNKR